MRILLLNLGVESTPEITQALSGQGYELTTGRRLTVDKILTLSPEVLITEATPSDLSCCGVISQIKASPDPQTPRIVMIVHGSALERARALDLGADDVISFPFDPVEFAARIRTQFRERQPQEELKTMLKYAVGREHYADIAVESLSAGIANKRRFWLIPAIFVLSSATLIAALYLGLSNRKSHKEALQFRAEIARMNSGLGRQSVLLQRTEQARDSLKAEYRSVSATRDSLKAQSDDLR